MTSDSSFRPRHFLWAGLDFMVDRDGRPVLIEANKSSHMLAEYVTHFGNERPFELTAARMNACQNSPCLLWRRGDPFPDADEDASFVFRHLAPFLDQPPLIGDVEDNRSSGREFVTRSGNRVRPGSVFRWWYGFPWTFERTGTLVINPNCLWVAVRDKLDCYRRLSGATCFRVPRAYPVATSEEAEVCLDEHPTDFSQGFVIKPRVGWGGYGIQVAGAGEAPRLFSGRYMLSERVVPHLDQGRFWDARVFVMDGQYLGGLRHSSHSPNTNFFQGGLCQRLDDATAALLEPAALEAVRLLDDAAEEIHAGPVPDTLLTSVVY